MLGQKNSFCFGLKEIFYFFLKIRSHSAIESIWHLGWVIETKSINFAGILSLLEILLSAAKYNVMRVTLQVMLFN